VKFLRSPAVTGALVLIALAAVIYQFLPGSRGRGSRSGAGTPVAAAAATRPLAAAVAAPASTRSSAKRPGGIDRNYVGMHFHGWVAGAARDPFLLNKSPSSKKIAIKAPPVLAKWKLKAILLQTGSRMAAINNQIYREGDMIEGYKIVSIDEDTVWFQTPDSREHLGFQRRAATRQVLPSMTNAPPDGAPTEGAAPAEPPVVESDEVSGTKP
jgi:hypothetical protein